MSESRIGLLSQCLPPSPHWTSKDVPDQSGKVVLVTGSNRGIGREIARVLLSNNAKVYIAARDETSAQQTVKELKEETGKQDVFFLKLDLADLSSIKTAVEEFTKNETKLHTLYNNGALLLAPVELLTKQGYQGQFGTNVLGHFYLTKLLLPILIATAKDSLPGAVRVVTVSSIAHNFGIPPEGINWDTIGPNPDLEIRKKVGSSKLYAQSKLGNILISNELARRVSDKNIVATSLHPGGINSSPSKWNIIARLLMYYFLDDVAHGAITPLYAGTAPAAAELNGKYLTVWARLTLPSEKALDLELQERLWEWCEDQVKNL
ncbi:NAD-P-binding protein [Multifurca ochricompacta]|uniref:NAD-P-binding protein n=1 Tax=Multifurca ochricompacta TaxID=376703 RepID=A0AAD4M7M0_9AGAM|nr:NAD-P-binding protein [Multifurca ochricompacta]